MRFISLLIPFALSLASIAACGGGTKFAASNKGAIRNSGDELPCKPGDEDCPAPDDPSLTDHYRYVFELAEGKKVIKQGPASVLSQIFLNELVKPLKDDDQIWKVTYRHKETELLEGALGIANLDLASVSGLVSVEAEFYSTADKRSARVVRSIFVDATPPTVSLVDLGKNASGAQKIYWNAYDNFGLNKAKTTLIACKSKIDAFLPQSQDELQVLPANCVIAMADGKIHEKPSETVLEDFPSQDGSEFYSQLLLYAEDEVGFGSAVWMSQGAEGAARLELSSNPHGAFYTNLSSLSVNLFLSKIDLVGSVNINDVPSEWASYELSIFKDGQSVLTSNYDKVKNQTLPTQDGFYPFTFSVAHRTDPLLKSNTVPLNLFVDRTKPKVKVTSIHIDSNLLNETATVDVKWNVEDASPIDKQVIEIQLRGQTSWEKLADLGGAQRVYSFTWGQRAISGFTIRVTATDRATNFGSGENVWIPQIFNTALLTQGVECLYCHIKIQGDMGGINFPSQVRDDTGAGFKVTGKIYATNLVPQRFRVYNTASGYVDNYNNVSPKIFPKNNVFPSVSEAQLRERMNGVLRYDGKVIERVYDGPAPGLVINGIAPKPCFEVNGEVMIKGDIVIGGCFKGQGSIYATGSIFVISDLTAMNPITLYPTDPVASKTLALQHLAQGKDQLFLGALKQVVVGTPENEFTRRDNPIPVPTALNPYSWLPQSEFQAICKKPSRVPNDTGANEPAINSDWTALNPDDSYRNHNAGSRFPARTSRVICGGMSDIQAYLYASEAVHVRTYRSHRIIGGIFTPRAAISSAYAGKGTPAWINPENNEPVTHNTIYFDERLKHGSKVGEAIKSFFDQ